MSEARKFRYEFTLQFSGEIEVYPEEGEDEEDVAEWAYDDALTDALHSRRYDVIDHELQEVVASV